MSPRKKPTTEGKALGRPRERKRVDVIKNFEVSRPGFYMSIAAVTVEGDADLVDHTVTQLNAFLRSKMGIEVDAVDATRTEAPRIGAFLRSSPAPHAFRRQGRRASCDLCGLPPDSAIHREAA